MTSASHNVMVTMSKFSNDVGLKNDKSTVLSSYRKTGSLSIYTKLQAIVRFKSYIKQSL